MGQTNNPINSARNNYSSINFSKIYIKNSQKNESIYI